VWSGEVEDAFGCLAGAKYLVDLANDLRATHIAKQAAAKKAGSRG
jgi:hypothetical protein